MNKNSIRLTESQLHNVIEESVKRVLREENGQYNVGGSNYATSGIAPGDLNKVRDYVNRASQIYEQLRNYINAMNASKNFTQGYAQLGSYLNALYTYVNYNMQK